MTISPPDRHSLSRHPLGKHPLLADTLGETPRADISRSPPGRQSWIDTPTGSVCVYVCVCAVADLKWVRGMHTPPGSKLFQFHAVYGNFAKLYAGAPPPPGELAPHLRGNLGSSTDVCVCVCLCVCVCVCACVCVCVCMYVCVHAFHWYMGQILYFSVFSAVFFRES